MISVQDLWLHCLRPELAVQRTGGGRSSSGRVRAHKLIISSGFRLFYYGITVSFLHYCFCYFSWAIISLVPNPITRPTHKPKAIFGGLSPFAFESSKRSPTFLGGARDFLSKFIYI